MKYLSVCSGIEAASVAWHPLGWTPLAFSEIEAFPRAVLEHHYPDTPLHGDFTVLKDQPWIVDADVLVGGTPCQAFSVAGLRNSLADDRGNLSLEFIRLADSIDAAREAQGRDPAVIVWENVPGVLSVKDNAFGCFLAALAGDVDPYVPLRGKWTNAGVVDGPERQVAWRILDAQYFGLAQRRRRVFVVASARDGFDPAAVLLEFEGVRRDSPPRRETGQGFTHSVAPSLTSSGRGAERGGDTRGQDPVVACIHEAPIVTHSLRGEGFDASEDGTGRGTPLVPVSVAHTLQTQCGFATEDGTGRGSPLVPVAFSCKDSGNDASADLSPTLRAMPHHGSHANGGGQMAVAYAFQPRIARNGRGDMGEVVNALNAQSGETGKGDAAPCVAVADTLSVGANQTTGFHTEVTAVNMAVRRLTPVECERLQGFPDGYTNIPWRKQPTAPDGPRYKALGNSMAVPCMRWIGTRIARHLRGEI